MLNSLNPKGITAPDATWQTGPAANVALSDATSFSHFSRLPARAPPSETARPSRRTLPLVWAWPAEPVPHFRVTWLLRMRKWRRRNRYWPFRRCLSWVDLTVHGTRDPPHRRRRTTKIWIRRRIKSREWTEGRWWSEIFVEDSVRICLPILVNQKFKS